MMGKENDLFTNISPKDEIKRAGKDTMIFNHLEMNEKSLSIVAHRNWGSDNRQLVFLGSYEGQLYIQVCFYRIIS